MTLTSIFLLVLGAGIPTLGESLSPISLTTVEVVPQGWGDANPENIEKILHSVVKYMEEASGVCIGKNLRVEPSGGPVVLYKRDPDGSYRIRLRISGRYWSQLVYQFSHEFGHIIANYKPDPGPHAWFEESVCEAMSFQVLSQLSSCWKTDPPLESLRKYAPHLSNYVLQMSSQCTPVEMGDISKWYSENKTKLQNAKHDRKLIRSFSRIMSIFLEENPHLWKNFSQLGRGESTADESLHERIDRWISSWTVKDEALADRIKTVLFGVPTQTESGSSKNQP